MEPIIPALEEIKAFLDKYGWSSQVTTSGIDDPPLPTLANAMQLLLRKYCSTRYERVCLPRLKLGIASGGNSSF